MWKWLEMNPPKHEGFATWTQSRVKYQTQTSGLVFIMVIGMQTNTAEWSTMPMTICSDWSMQERLFEIDTTTLLSTETGKRQRTTVERLKRWKPWWLRIGCNDRMSHRNHGDIPPDGRTQACESGFFFKGAYSCKRPCKEMHAAQMADVLGQWNSNWHFMAIDGKQLRIPCQGGVSEFSQCTHV